MYCIFSFPVEANVHVKEPLACRRRLTYMHTRKHTPDGSEEPLLANDEEKPEGGNEPDEPLQTNEEENDEDEPDEPLQTNEEDNDEDEVINVPKANYKR